MRPPFLPCLCGLLAVAASLPCAPRAFAQDEAPFAALDLGAALSPDGLAAKLANERVVFIGEMHTRYGDHLNQLAIIKRLHARDPNLAIGVEYFEQPFQRQVDDYIDGRENERQFLRATEYYEHWGYDYRLYAPILRYARAQHIPVRALNVPDSLPAAVAKVGIDGLTKQQRAYLPQDIEPAGPSYRERLRAAFQAHDDTAAGDFDRFVKAQLVWDEGMAESAAAYLRAHPQRRMVILAGAGHVEFGAGIPRRLERRVHAAYAIVLNADGAIEPHMADYLLLSKPQSLPPAGILGAALQESDDRCRIRSLSPGGAGREAGLRQGDTITAIDGQPIRSVADVHVALWDKKPGDKVEVEVRRKRFFRPAVPMNFRIELAARGRNTRRR